MANIIDFVMLHGGKSFAEKPFCPVDAAVLCQLSYLKFEHVGGAGTLLGAFTAPERARLFEDSRFGAEQRRLCFEAAFSDRYRNMKIQNVRSVMSEANDVCFCAMVLWPEGSSPAVVFRGTDEYIVGWKEDFEMAYRCPVPAQSLSVGYLAEAAAGLDEFYVCGHSKGGNLAKYSAVMSAPDLRARIKLVYDLDGPGFAVNAEALPADRELSGRIMKIVPKQSVVGQLLHAGAVNHRVDSEGPSILQHDIFNWKIDEYGDFISLDDDGGVFASMMERLNANIARLSPKQIESFVDALFGILSTADVDNLVDFAKNWKKDSRRILSACIGLDDASKSVLADTVAALLFG